MLIALGLFTAICAMADWDWFMNNRRARLFVTLLGRDGARLLYAALGVGFLGLGVVLLQKQH